MTDFAQIPAVPIPVSTGFEFLNPAFAPFIANAAQFACDRVTYDFGAAAPPPPADGGVPPAAPQPFAGAVPAPTATPVPTVAPPPAAEAPPVETTLPDLAFTGSSTTTLATVAVALIALGAVLVGSSRPSRPP